MISNVVTPIKDKNTNTNPIKNANFSGKNGKAIPNIPHIKKINPNALAITAVIDTAFGFNNLKQQRQQDINCI